MRDLTQGQIDLLNLTNTGYGTICKFSKGFYGFLYETNKVDLINTETLEVVHSGYKICYIGEEIVIIGNFDLAVSLMVDYKILHRETLNVLYESDKTLKVVGDLIIEHEVSPLYRQSVSLNRKVFNLKGELLNIIETASDFEIEDTENKDLFIVKERNEFEQYNYRIYRYDRDKQRVLLEWSDDDYYINNIGDGIYQFFNHKDFKKSYVYDIVKEKSLEK